MTIPSINQSRKVCGEKHDVKVTYLEITSYAGIP